MSDLARSLVLEFYKRLYTSDGSRGFLCRGSAPFMHPVLNPNFYLGTVLSLDDIERDRRRFAVEFQQKRHWIQLFSEVRADELLTAAGYHQTLTCAFNVFTKPLVRVVNQHLDLRWCGGIAPEFALQYEEKASANSYNLTPTIRRQIERVLREFSDGLSFGLATAGDDLLAAVTTVRCGDLSLFINAWVDQPKRSEGIMRCLFVSALEREFAQGQRAALYWTLNPALVGKGDLSAAVRIFERSEL